MKAPVCLFCGRSGAGVTFALCPRFLPFGTACTDCERTIPVRADHILPQPLKVPSPPIRPCLHCGGVATVVEDGGAVLYCKRCWPATEAGLKSFAAFGAFVLDLLEDHTEWSPDTLDAIQQRAHNLNLANTDGQGNFRVLRDDHF